MSALSETAKLFLSNDQLQKLENLQEGVQLIQTAASLGILYMPTPATVVVYHGEPNEGWYEDDLLESAYDLMQNQEAVSMLKDAIAEKEKQMEKQDENSR